MGQAMQHTVYIGLGSNLGAREETLRGALEMLDSRDDVSVTQVSSFIETEPVGGPPQGRFLNAAAELHCDLEPCQLLDALQDVERVLGRERGIRWGPRTLDLDVLLYDDRVVSKPGLEIPHPLMHKRRFVLEPLCEIAPDVVHPALCRSIHALLGELTAPND
ncbi:MAG: 2-amino-4-hydroxy-6-hydroxymethyldihydropteridine diphosphokinase [Planctomycetota bacterium]|jgi:2-amino-4-hydroxy-6-hydroxymethyldihydropteridine diphosphokinase